MEQFKELDIEHWPALQEKLKQLWPQNVIGYYALYVNLKYPDIRQSFQFKVYCPRGDINYGFIATSVKGTLNCIICSTSHDTTQLEEALIQSNLVDWNLEIPVSSFILKSIMKIKPMLGFTHLNPSGAKMYFLDRRLPPYALSSPSNTYVAEIKQDLIEHVNNLWVNKHESTDFSLSVLAANGLSYGLYSTNHELLAWVFFNHYYFLSHLYTEEMHRKKGYAEFLLKYVANEQLLLGNDVYAYVTTGNDRSALLFDKLGFEMVDDSAFLHFKK